MRELGKVGQTQGGLGGQWPGGVNEVAEPGHIATTSEPEPPLFHLMPQADAQTEWQVIPKVQGWLKVRHRQPFRVVGQRQPREWPRVLPLPLKECLTDFLSQLCINREPQL